MKFEAPLIPGVLLRRYKRFLSDVRLDDGRVVTAHSSNTGSMMGVSAPGSRVWLRDSGNPARKYPLTWELVRTADGVMVGINTLLANRLVEEAVVNRVIPELAGYGRVRREVPYGEQRSRIDLLLRNDDARRCYVEVKNVTLMESGVAMFPDAVSLRGQKHLRELAAIARQGHEAVIFFCIQRDDATRFLPAEHIDAEYARLLKAAVQQGVTALAWRAEVNPQGIELSAPVQIDVQI